MKRDLDYYVGLKYPILLTEDEDNGVSYIEAEIPELPGCGSYGKNIEEALGRLNEAKEAWIKARLKRDLPIPEPVSEDDFSGKFLLRITPELHRNLARGAREESLSLNQYIRKIVENNLTLERVIEKIGQLEQEIIKLRTKVEVRSETAITTYTSMRRSGAFAGFYRANANEYPTIQVYGPEEPDTPRFTGIRDMTGGEHENKRG